MASRRHWGSRGRLEAAQSRPAQRAGQVALTWRAYDGHSLRLRQQKTGRELVVPCHPTLRAALDAWRRDAVSTHVLVSGIGRPWNADYLSRALRKAVRRIGLSAELGVHGLRHLAATSLAEARCSAHEIAAITGHRSLAMVQLYTAGTDQERLAKAAVTRLTTATSRPRR